MQLSEILAILVPIATGLLGVCCAALGWYAGKIYDRLQKNEADLTAHRLAVAENYVRHDRMQEIMRPITSSLSDIQIMLAKKADRQ
jgi:hypothetical protein